MIVSYRHCDFERRVIIDSPPWRYLVLESEREERAAILIPIYVCIRLYFTILSRMEVIMYNVIGLRKYRYSGGWVSWLLHVSSLTSVSRLT